jgi:succinate dehydrogenase/fumarate reductase flavoprotein subunit
VNVSYPASIRESLAKVEASRTRRLAEEYPRFAPQERQAILREFHPDYKRDAFRQLRVGPNKGDRTPHELADALEAAPLIAPGEPLPACPAASCDVLVIGGGGAGASAALLAQASGADVLLTTKLRFGDANTMMAQGGIQAADKQNDSPAIHYLDVIGGGGFCNHPELVEALVNDAPGVIAWLESLGVMFDTEPDGTLRTIHGGGTSRKRMHAARDYTGAEIMRVLRDEVRSHVGVTSPGEADGRPYIRVWEFRPAVELLLDPAGQAAGAILKDLDTGWWLVVHARAVIIATGGSGRLHYQGFPTTNHYGATGDGLVLAYRAGCKLAFIDTMQYHPTGAAFPEQILGQLVTEKVRGLGAQVCDAEGEQFVYPLETRDVEAAAFIRACRQRGQGLVTPSEQPAVWLDAPMIDLLHGPGTIARELPAMVRQYHRFGIDLVHEAILVYPTLHYQNGGVAIQPDGSTGVPGLFVAGEAAGGIHGRNRLMGNSLLDICVFGRRAGIAAADWAQNARPGPPGLGHLAAWQAERRGARLDSGSPSPVILPDYTRKDSLEKTVTEAVYG